MTFCGIEWLKYQVARFCGYQVLIPKEEGQPGGVSWKGEDFFPLPWLGTRSSKDVLSNVHQREEKKAERSLKTKCYTSLLIILN